VSAVSAVSAGSARRTRATVLVRRGAIVAGVAGVAVMCAGSARRLAAQTCTVSGTAATITAITGSGTCNTSGNATATIPRVVRMTTSQPTTPLTTPTAANYDAGFVQTTGPLLSMQSNAGHSVLVRSTAATFTATGGIPGPDAPRAAKPVADLRVDTTAAFPNNWAMATTNRTVRTRPTAALAPVTVQLFFRLLLSWTLDTPGTYTIPVVITLTSP
jgi:hypothetical protein